ncbi:hypothetical protein OOJ91_12215 [Micromonospora lupini]|uniref:hypothetical protein n=1 Tax=Micromonospora lupini TaxID=285679 RepID=UPI002252C9A7|nr:hypothetical protein [Micromonospora lupini]MCX5066643.1 hypothetical protein [Micromonospora lupini]
MGLARELTMGTRRTRARVGFTGDFTTLRRLTAATAPDVAEFRATIERVAATPTRLRFAEGAAYNAACKRFRELTGEKIGPETGTY